MSFKTEGSWVSRQSFVVAWAKGAYQAFCEANEVQLNPAGSLLHLSPPSFLLAAFVADDVGSIFEEHRICSNTNLCQILQTVQDKGVFITDENKFIFTNVLVGHRATARFKIRNVGKVPCNVVLSIRPISGKVRNRSQGDCCSSKVGACLVLQVHLTHSSPALCR